METSDLVIGRAPDAVAVLGDNQYANGSLTEFQNAFDLSWGRFLDLIHPVPATTSTSSTRWRAATTPTSERAAGDPAKGYYSWDLGDWHLVALNSDCGTSGCDNLGAGRHGEKTWLDARPRRAPDVVHAGLLAPPAASATPTAATTPAVKPLWQALYPSGADIVLNGHDHGYQRWAPMNAQTARPDPDGPTQFIVGTGGKDISCRSPCPPPAPRSATPPTSACCSSRSPARARTGSWRGDRRHRPRQRTTWCHRPEAKASAPPPSPVARRRCAFDATASADHYGKTLTGFAWDFGDGATGSGQTEATHAYAAPGAYDADAHGHQRARAEGAHAADGSASPRAPADRRRPPAAATGTTDTTASTPATTETTTETAATTPVPPAVASLRAPRIFEAGMTRRSFRRGSSTAFRFRLTADARVRIVIQRRRGRRWSTVAAFTRDARAGRVRAAFDGRVRRRLLAPGAYRAVLTATDATDAARTPSPSRSASPPPRTCVGK